MLNETEDGMEPTDHPEESASQINSIRDIASALDGLGLETTNPIHAVLTKLTKHLSFMSVAQVNLQKQNKSLQDGERKVKVDAAVRFLTNPMSVRVVRHNYRLLFLIEDLLLVFNPEDAPLVSTDLPTVNDLIAAATGVFKELVRLIKRESEMHTVVQKSHIGWKVASVLDEEELDIEEQEDSKILSTRAVMAAEKQFMAFSIDKAKTLQYAKGGGYGSSRGGRGGRGGKVGRGGKGTRGGKSSPKLNAISHNSGGKITKPRNGGCHRCGGPHYVRACPKPLLKE